MKFKVSNGTIKNTNLTTGREKDTIYTTDTFDQNFL